MAADEKQGVEVTREWDAAKHRYWDNLKKLQILFKAKEIRGAVRVAAPLFPSFDLTESQNPSPRRVEGVSAEAIAELAKQVAGAVCD